MAFLIRSLTLALCCATLAYAMPPRGRREISYNEFDNFRLMRQYAVAAYCQSNIVSPGDQLTCATGNCPKVEAANTSSVSEFEKLDRDTDVAGFVALDHTNKRIVMAFRGSTTLDSYVTDIRFGLKETYICEGCQAHEGFWQSWLDAKDTVIPIVKKAAASWSTYQITSTGHSLGGAIATLAAAELRKYNMDVALYSYGAPRVGEKRISKYISDQGNNFRLTHYNDLVPRLPDRWLMGYVHISPEYYIKTRNKETVEINDIQVINSGFDVLKGNAAWLSWDLDAHNWYFGTMYPCRPGLSKQKRLQIRGVEDGAEILTTF